MQLQLLQGGLEASSAPFALSSHQVSHISGNSLIRKQRSIEISRHFKCDFNFNDILIYYIILWKGQLANPPFQEADPSAFFHNKRWDLIGRKVKGSATFQSDFANATSVKLWDKEGNKENLLSLSGKNMKIDAWNVKTGWITESVDIFRFHEGQRSSSVVELLAAQDIGGHQEDEGEHFEWKTDGNSNLICFDLSPFLFYRLEKKTKKNKAHSVTLHFHNPRVTFPCLTDSLRHTQPPSRVKRTRSRHIWQLRATGQLLHY